MFKNTHNDLMKVANDLANSVLCPNVMAHLVEWQVLHQEVGELIEAMAFRLDLMLMADDLVNGKQLNVDDLDHLEGILSELKDTEEAVPVELAISVQLLTGAMSYGFAADALRDMMPELRAGIEHTIH